MADTPESKPRPGVLRTPDSCFAGIHDYPWPPSYFMVEPGLRMAYVDAGPRDAAETLLLLHGEPMWGYLYRKMIPGLLAAGHRVVVPDLIGFGRSDKPVRPQDYSYSGHVAWLTGLLEHLDLRQVTLFGQDWGGLLGGRLLAENLPRFARAVFSNTDLPGQGPGIPGLEPQAPLSGEELMDRFGLDWRATVDDQERIDPHKVHALIESGPVIYFLMWRVYSQSVAELWPSRVIPGWCLTPVSSETLAAYDAPFPSQHYVAGARRFPLLVPITPDDPERRRNDAAWRRLEGWENPVLTLWGDHCPHTYMSKGQQFRDRIPGAGLPGIEHKVYRASHFIQEDLGPEIAEEIVAFMRATG